MRSQQELSDNVTEINSRVQSSSTYPCSKVSKVLGIVPTVITVGLLL